jgi:hypothetical protein
MQLELYRALLADVRCCLVGIHEKIRTDNSTHDKVRIREDFHMDEPLERKKSNTVTGVLDLDHEPEEYSRTGNREKRVNASRDEALIKQLEASIYSEGIRQKALDVLHKRIASREISENMLLRIAVSLGKSTAGLLEVDRHPRRRW